MSTVTLFGALRFAADIVFRSEPTVRRGTFIALMTASLAYPLRKHAEGTPRFARPSKAFGTFWLAFAAVQVARGWASESWITRGLGMAWGFAAGVVGMLELVAMPREPVKDPAARPGLTRVMSTFTEGLARGPFPEEANIPRPTIQVVMKFDEGMPTMDEMKTLVENSILKFYRFKSIPTLDAKGRWIWQPDPHFSLDHHLMSQTVKDMPDLTKFVESLFDSSEIDPDQPRWQIYVVQFEGQADKGAVVMNVDHVLGDGLSFVRLALEMVRDEKGNAIDFLNPAVASKGKGGASADKSASKPRTTKIVKGIKGVTGALYLGYSLLTSHVKVLASQLGPGDSKTLIKDEYAPYQFNTARTTILLPVLSLDAIKKMKATTKEGLVGCTVNDVLTAALAGALRRYLTHRQDPILSSESANLQVRALLPFSFPRSFNDDDLHNSWSFISVALPVGLATTEERLKDVNSTMTNIKRSATPLAFKNIQMLGTSMLPQAAAAQASLETMTKHTMVFTNVPGFPEPVYLAGKKINSLWPIISNVVPQISALSYAGQITINLVVDPAIFIDHELLPGMWIDELNELKDLLLGDESKDVDVLWKSS